MAEPLVSGVERLPSRALRRALHRSELAPGARSAIRFLARSKPAFGGARNDWGPFNLSRRADRVAYAARRMQRPHRVAVRRRGIQRPTPRATPLTQLDAHLFGDPDRLLNQGLHA